MLPKLERDYLYFFCHHHNLYLFRAYKVLQLEQLNLPELIFELLTTLPTFFILVYIDVLLLHKINTIIVYILQQQQQILIIN